MALKKKPSVCRVESTRPSDQPKPKPTRSKPLEEEAAIRVVIGGGGGGGGEAMGVVGALLGPEAEALVRLRAAAWRLRREVAAATDDDEHWAFAYSMLHRVSRSFALVIQQLGPDLRNAVSIHHLFLLLPLPLPLLVRDPLD
jgi:hypothetical protein